MSVTIQLNGAPLTLEAPCSVAELLERRGLDARLVAVELNEELVPRSERGSRSLDDGDRIEVVTLVGGG